jgi:hypothetical protein
MRQQIMYLQKPWNQWIRPILHLIFSIAKCIISRLFSNLGVKEFPGLEHTADSTPTSLSDKTIEPFDLA